MGAGASGGVALKDILPALLLGGGDALSSIFAPTPFQPRVPYLASGNPDNRLGRDVATELRGILQSVLGDTQARAHEAIDLPDAVVQPLPSFSGEGLPFPIGVSAGPGSLAQGGHLDPFHPSSIDLDLTRLDRGVRPGAPAGPPLPDLDRGPAADDHGGGNGGRLRKESLIRQSFLDQMPSEAMGGLGLGLEGPLGDGSPEHVQAALSLLQHAIGMA